MPGGPLSRPPASNRSLVEGIHLRAAGGAEADVHPRRLRNAAGYPEVGLGRHAQAPAPAGAIFGGNSLMTLVAQGRQRLHVEGLAPGVVADVETRVIDHGAPTFSTLSRQRVSPMAYVT